MARTLNELVGPQDSQHVQPLLANEGFRKRADAALQSADDAQLRSAQAAAANEDYAAIIRMFSGAKQSLAAIAKKFPEAGRFTDEASQMIDRAMQAAVGEAPVQQPAPGSTPSQNTPGQSISQPLRSQAPSAPEPDGPKSPFVNRR